MGKKGTLRLLKGNTKIDVKGIWFPYKEYDIQLLVARLGNVEYEKAMTTRVRKDSKALTSKTALTDKALECQTEIMAEFILLGWSGVFDDEGKEILYTPELGLKYFNDPEYHWFYKFVQQCANDADRFEEETRKAEKGN